MEFNYSSLRQKIREKYRREQDFAVALGIGRVSLSQKLNNSSDFTCSQMLKAAGIFHMISSIHNKIGSITLWDISGKYRSAQ